MVLTEREATMIHHSKAAIASMHFQKSVLCGGCDEDMHEMRLIVRTFRMAVEALMDEMPDRKNSLGYRVAEAALKMVSGKDEDYSAIARAIPTLELMKEIIRRKNQPEHELVWADPEGRVNARRGE
jgi:hypothetical protein